MVDREKVIKGLTPCTAWAGLHECQPKVGDDCPYVDEADCKLTIMREALELLKEQEPKQVNSYWQSGNMLNMLNKWERKGFCPRCNQEMRWMLNRSFCGFCGQEVKWDD